jgi:hypothetical protein
MGKLAITRTVIPLEYDKSTEGFNAWTLMIRNSLHVNDQAFTVHTIIPEANKVLKFHQVPSNTK